MSVRNVQKSPFLYIFSMRKSLTIGRGPKWRSSFSRPCLYNVRECGKRPKIVIFVYAFYGKVAGNRSKTKMAIEFFTYMPVQRTLVWETFLSRHFCIYFLWGSCWQSVEDPNGARVIPVHAYAAYAISVYTFDGRAVGNRSMSKMAV